MHVETRYVNPLTEIRPQGVPQNQRPETTAAAIPLEIRYIYQITENSSHGVPQHQRFEATIPPEVRSIPEYRNIMPMPRTMTRGTAQPGGTICIPTAQYSTTPGYIDGTTDEGLVRHPVGPSAVRTPLISIDQQGVRVHQLPEHYGEAQAPGRVPTVDPEIMHLMHSPQQ